MKKKTDVKRKDTQLVEIAGRNWLISQLIQDGVEVARPERDCGVDLIAYTEKPVFVACRIQIKVSSGSSFAAYREKYRGMLLVHVWHIKDAHKTEAYAMTWDEAFQIAKIKGWTKKPSWKKNGRWNISTVNTKSDLYSLLKPYKISSDRWKRIIIKGLKEKTYKC